jgi:hypothetical protein
MFDHTCNFRIPARNRSWRIELELIDFGAEEVFEDEDGILIYAPLEVLVLFKKLENRESSFFWIWKFLKSQRNWLKLK